jgi:hypothetical protein
MRIFIGLLLLAFTSQVALADCDWSKIKPLDDGGFEYSQDLHLCVGQLVQASAVKDQQIQDLNGAIQLKDLALKASDDRATLWSTTSQGLEDRLQKIDATQKHNDWLFFAAGAVTVIGAGWMASRLLHP